MDKILFSKVLGIFEEKILLIRLRNTLKTFLGLRARIEIFLNSEGALLGVYTNMK
jgi:hypothetical protein